MHPYENMRWACGVAGKINHRIGEELSSLTKGSGVTAHLNLYLGSPSSSGWWGAEISDKRSDKS